MANALLTMPRASRIATITRTSPFPRSVGANRLMMQDFPKRKMVVAAAMSATGSRLASTLIAADGIFLNPLKETLMVTGMALWPMLIAPPILKKLGAVVFACVWMTFVSVRMTAVAMLLIGSKNKPEPGHISRFQEALTMVKSRGPLTKFMNCGADTGKTELVKEAVRVSQGRLVRLAAGFPKDSDINHYKLPDLMEEKMEQGISGILLKALGCKFWPLDPRRLVVENIFTPRPRELLRTAIHAYHAITGISPTVVVDIDNCYMSHEMADALTRYLRDEYDVYLCGRRFFLHEQVKPMGEPELVKGIISSYGLPLETATSLVRFVGNRDMTLLVHYAKSLGDKMITMDEIREAMLAIVESRARLAGFLEQPWAMEQLLDVLDAGEEGIRFEGFWFDRMEVLVRSRLFGIRDGYMVHFASEAARQFARDQVFLADPPHRTLTYSKLN